MVKHLHQKKVYVTLSGRKPQLAVRCVVSATEVILPVRVQTIGRDGLRLTILNLKLNICLMLHDSPYLNTPSGYIAGLSVGFTPPHHAGSGLTTMRS